MGDALAKVYDCYDYNVGAEVPTSPAPTAAVMPRWCRLMHRLIPVRPRLVGMS